ncbi:MAG: Uma2 family endonuclease [Candidatus Tectomicrobia bacterium]|uniref:Uma2 family endonuclease n=1 Tax=Tectimicrobiota bacterium TaxID=2528274 RepID=A0A932CL97_UNCTE|nr:Uma2 family endonuclease [Candidatus Tectomicrobia bacterium]
MTDAVAQSRTKTDLSPVMTEEEFVACCRDEDVKAEFVDGRVIIVPPESRRDEAIRWFVGTVLHIFVEHHHLGEVYGPNLTARLRVGLRRVPDLLFISHDRLSLLRESHLEGAPDLTLEIVSPDSAARDWHDKYLEYEAAGVREYWVIDPQVQRMDVYQLNETGRYEALPQEEGVYRSAAVPGFWLRPDWLWQEPLPGTLEILRELGVLQR